MWRYIKECGRTNGRSGRARVVCVSVTGRASVTWRASVIWLGIWMGWSVSIAFAEGHVKTVDVNGYNAYLINTHNGNRISVTFNVRAGSLHDEPVKFAGLAHLWEHTIFLGSEKYPGASTFKDIAEAIGADWNAYTSHNRIFYHLTVHPDSVARAIDLLGAMVSRPAMNEADFEKEKLVVIDEAAKYQQNDMRALHSSIFLNLLPAGDRWAMYNIGTSDQLRAMTLEHLKALYQANYTPESAEIVIAGNFDGTRDQPITEDQLVSWLRESFVPPRPDADLARRFPEIAPARTIRFPSILATPVERRWLELSTAVDQRTLVAFFEVPESLVGESVLLETVADYLNLRSDGSFNRELERKGLIRGAGVSAIRAGNRNLMCLSIGLTEAGAKKRADILRTFFSVVGRVRATGVRESLFQFLRDRNFIFYRDRLLRSNGAAEFFASRLDDAASPSEILDLQGTFGVVTPLAFREAMAHIFRPDRMIGGYMGPDVESETRAPIFSERRLRLVDLSSEVAGWTKALEPGGRDVPEVSPEVSIVTLPIRRDFQAEAMTSVVSHKPARVLASRNSGELIGLAEHSGVSAGAGEGAVALELKLPLQNFRSRLAMNVFVSAFRSRVSGELEYLDAMGLLRGFGFGDGMLSVLVNGSPENTKQTIRWIFETLQRFEPTADEVEQAREKILTAYLQERSSQWPAMTAAEGVSTLTDRERLGMRETIAALESSLKADEVRRLASALLARADRLMAIVGAFSEADALGLADTISDLFPNGLSESERRAWSERWLTIDKSVSLWVPLMTNMRADTFGQSMAIQGPSVLSATGTLNEEYAALLLASLAIRKAVFQLNRSEKGLGYVHGAGLSTNRIGDSRLVLYGQTDGVDQLLEIERGWKTVLASIESRTFERSLLEEARTGFLLKRGMLPETHLDLAGEILQSLEQTGQPNLREQEVALIRALDLGWVLDVANRYIHGGRPAAKVIAALNPCDGYLAELGAARSALTGR